MPTLFPESGRKEPGMTLSAPLGRTTTVLQTKNEGMEKGPRSKKQIATQCQQARSQPDVTWPP